MDGPPHRHPTLDRFGAPSAAVGHPGYADSLLSHRYAAAAGMDPLLLQHQLLMRRQDRIMLAAAASAAAASAATPTGNSVLMSSLARQEEELARLSSLSDARERILMEEEEGLAAREHVMRYGRTPRPRLWEGAIGNDDGDDRALPPRREEELTALRMIDARARERILLDEELVAREMMCDRVAVARATQAARHALHVERIVALQEQQAARQREFERARQAQVFSRALRRHHAAGTAGLVPETSDRFLDGDALSARSMGLTEELALRERLRRRMLEEEAVDENQREWAELSGRQQAMMDGRGEDPPPPDDREQLARLLRLQQMSDQERAASTDRNEYQISSPRRVPQEARAKPNPNVAGRQGNRGLAGGRGEAAPPARDAELDRLLQLRRMPDEELIRLAARVQNSQRVGQRLVDATMPLRTSPPRFNGAADRDPRLGAVQRGSPMQRHLSNGSEKVGGGSPASPARQRRQSNDPNKKSEPLASGNDNWKAGPLRTMSPARFNGAADQDPRLGAVQRGNPMQRHLSNGSEKVGGGSSASPARQSRQSNDPNKKSEPLASINDNWKAGAKQRHLSNGLEKVGGGHRAGPAWQRPQSNGPDNNTEPLVSDNDNGKGDTKGNPPPTENNPAPSPIQGDALSDNVPSNGNIITKFLTEVSQVPEIAPAVADPLPDDGDPILRRGAFPDDVDVTLAELDAGGLDLKQCVTDCIAAIEPYNVDLKTTSGVAGTARQSPSLDSTRRAPAGVPHPAQTTVASGMTSPPSSTNGPHAAAAIRMMGPPPPASVPLAAVSAETTREISPKPLLANINNPTPAAISGPRHVPMLEELITTQQAHEARVFKSQSKSNNPSEPSRQFAPLAKKEETESKCPVVSKDVPMTKATHKAEKKEVRKYRTRAAAAREREKGTHARDGGPPRRLVRHALFRGVLDMDAVERRAKELAVKEREEARTKRERVSAESCDADETAGAEVAAAAPSPTKRRRVPGGEPTPRAAGARDAGSAPSIAAPSPTEPEEGNAARIPPTRQSPRNRRMPPPTRRAGPARTSKTTI